MSGAAARSLAGIARAALGLGPGAALERALGAFASRVAS
jgi:hypothetical protein